MLSGAADTMASTSIGTNQTKPLVWVRAKRSEVRQDYDKSIASVNVSEILSHARASGRL